MQTEKTIRERLKKYEGEKDFLICDINDKRNSDSGVDGLDAFRGLFQMYEDVDRLNENIRLLKWVLDEGVI
jgi:hypothetical protein